MYTSKGKDRAYLYEVGYGEESAVARIIVRADAAGTEGLFLIKQDGPRRNRLAAKRVTDGLPVRCRADPGCRLLAGLTERRCVGAMSPQPR